MHEFQISNPEDQKRLAAPRLEGGPGKLVPVLSWASRESHTRSARPVRGHSSSTEEISAANRISSSRSAGSSSGRAATPTSSITIRSKRSRTSSGRPVPLVLILAPGAKVHGSAHAGKRHSALASSFCASCWKCCAISIMRSWLSRSDIRCAIFAHKVA